jgi:hypothetical protein
VSPARVWVDVASHAQAQAAGVDGLVLSAGVPDAAAGSGTVQLAVDTSSFAGAFGGGYGQRLHLAALPACALTTPAGGGLPGADSATDHCGR